MKKFPHVYAILFAVIIVSAILTYIVSPNQYDFKLDESGNPTRVIDPDTYHPVERTPVDPWKMMLAIPAGMGEVAGIIFFIFIVGGSFNIVQATGAVESGIRATATSSRGKRRPCCSRSWCCSASAAPPLAWQRKPWSSFQCWYPWRLPWGMIL